MTMTGAGKRDRRIDLRRQIAGTNELGEPLGTFITVDQVWANVRPMTGRELAAGGQIAQGGGYTTFRILWRNDIELTWILVHDGQIYDLKSMLEIGRREELELLGQARPR